MRGDYLYCPLSLSLESYWTCDADCTYCIARRLNHIWGNEQKATDPNNLEKKLQNALKNKNPKTIISQALAKKKPFYLGRKADPYQPIELTQGTTRGIIKVLAGLNWNVVICTKYTDNLEYDLDLICRYKDVVSVLTEITVGAEHDWELFEGRKTTPIDARLRTLKKLKKRGVTVGVRGEPFIPGYHTIKQFKDMVLRIKQVGLNSFNTYNFHMNEHNLKRLLALGVDIERIWKFNQDTHWKKIQTRLCAIARNEGMILGCPDFVNVPQNWYHSVNTCCGIDINNAFTFNTHVWRNLLLEKTSPYTILQQTWEGIGLDPDKNQAKIILTSDSKDFYTFKNAGLI